jgi:hypothetical protein
MSTPPALHLHCYPPAMSRVSENLLRFRPKPPAQHLFSPNQFYHVCSSRITSSLFHSSSVRKLEKDLSSFRGEPIAHMLWQGRTWRHHLLARKQRLQTGRWLKCKNSSLNNSKLPPTLIWWVPPSLVLLDICVV